jgi:hypothetical protein
MMCKQAYSCCCLPACQLPEPHQEDLVQCSALLLLLLLLLLL